MKVLVIGATGRTGSQVVEQGLGFGFHITAFARSPEKVTLTHDLLRVVQGDTTQPETVEAAVAGHDAVIDCIGTRDMNAPTHLFSKTTAHLIAAMTQHNVARYVMLSGLGAGSSRADLPPISRLMFRFMLSAVYEDKTHAESLLMASPLEWVIVRPPEVVDKPRRNTYRVPERPPYGREIGRGDLAFFLLFQTHDISYVHKTPVVCW
jgi:putative NADH-flavin reductase